MTLQVSRDAFTVPVDKKDFVAARAWIVATRALLALLWSADRLLCALFPLGPLRTRHERYRSSATDLQGLASLLRLPADDLPPIGNCAGSSDLLLLLARTVLTEKTALIVEFGSGTSSFVIARCLELNGAGRLISFDHSPSFAEITRRQLARRQLAAEIRIVPLLPANSPSQPGAWYEVNDLPDAIDMIVVDGPPSGLHPETRSGAGPSTFAKLRAGGTVFLDDASRPGERRVAARWRKDHSQIQFTYLDRLKGTLVGRKCGATECVEVIASRAAAAHAGSFSGAESTLVA